MTGAMIARALRILAALMWLALPGAASAANCSIEAPAPSHLNAASLVDDYRSILRACRGPDGSGVAVRSFTLAGQAGLLIADPDALTTRLERASCWTCQETSEDALADTRMVKAIRKSAEAPALVKRDFLKNAGLAHGEGSSAYFTGDLCPSTRPLDRAFLDDLATKQSHAPIALSISGLWLLRHFADFRWLVDRQAAGAFEITWVDHSYHHPFRRGVANDRNFLLTPGVDAEAEILDTERLLIANGQTPSLFFRFPGLISSAPLMQTARQNHLITLGADAWLAIGQPPKPGSILLLHPNGNEEIGLKIFDADFARGAIARPLAPLNAAP